MRRVFVIVSALAFSNVLPTLPASAADAPDPTGIWLNDTGRGAIEIKACGNALCGNVVWVKDATDAKGCGKQIIGNVAPAGQGIWDNGWIYSPEKGRKYNVELKPLANGTLRVTGYAGLRFLSKTMIWKRAPADLQLCGQLQNQIDAKSDQPAGAAVAKQDSKPQVAIVTPPSAPKPATTPANEPGATASDNTSSPQTGNSAAGSSAAGNGAAGNAANEPPPSQPEPPAVVQDNAKLDTSSPGDEQTASADDGTGSDLEQKLNGLGLGKVFSKTKSGKCKLDLPWVKLTIDCEQ